MIHLIGTRWSIQGIWLTTPDLKSEFDENDAVIEEALKFFLPNRPVLDHWTWEKPYRLLLDAID
jgi:hypothetical protein